MSEDRDHRAEVGCQMSEGRGREKNRWTMDDRCARKVEEPEVRGQRSEVGRAGGPREEEDRFAWMMDDEEPEVRGRRAEVRYQRAEIPG